MFYVSSTSGKQSPFNADHFRFNRLKEISPVTVSKDDSKNREPSTDPRIVSAAQAYSNVAEKPPVREPAVIAKQIMSPVLVTLRPEDSLDTAQNLFNSKKFRHIPIVADERTLIGIISDRDFIAEPGTKLKSKHSDKDAELVKDRMATNILTARPETKIKDIAKIMIEEHIGAMPIVDSEELLTGILTRGDILRAVINNAPIQMWT